MTRVLALDIGTSSVRTLVYDERGREVDATTAKADVEHVGLGEIDPEQLLDATLDVVSQGERHGDLDARAISCFWHSLVAVDDRLRPLTPVLTWEDVRAAPHAERLDAELDAQAVHARTGCPLHPSYWPAKIAWLAHERPDAFDNAAWFLSFSDLVNERLTGELATSVSIASGTGLLDVASCEWDVEVLQAVGVDAKRLPRLVGHAQAREGWHAPVGDGACSNVGAGCDTRERAALMIGTSGAYRVLYEPDGTPLPTGLFRYRVDDRRIIDGGSLSNGGNLVAWLQKTLDLGDDGELGDQDAHGLTFLALLGGERSPGWRGGARGAIHGLTFATTAQDIFQAALESVAYRFAEVVELVPDVREIVATGGALRAEPSWTQLIADVLGRPLLPSQVHESSARGAAVLALERLGVEPDPAPVGEPVEPRPERTKIYAAARERQRRLYETVA